MKTLTSKTRGILATFAVVMIAGGLYAVPQGHQFQQRRSQAYEYEMQNPAEDPPDVYEKTEFAFARLRYRQGGYGGYGYGRGRNSWAIDSNKAERQFVRGVRRLTRIHTRSVEEIVDIDSDEMFNWPWLYAVEVGHWGLNESQATRLRAYLDRGGFLMVDDFHGTREWEVFMAGMQRIFPDRRVVDLNDDEAIFHILYNLDQRFQVPGFQYVRSGRTYEQDGVQPRWRAIFDDKGRVQVAICHNMDLGDAWEWSDDPEYPERFAGLAYRIGINYITYAMTH